MSAAEDPRVTRSRALILEAARRTFAAHGFDETSVDDIAAAAGITKRTIYNIYGDKESLFRATIGLSIATADRFTTDLVGQMAALADLERDLPILAERLARDVLLSPVVPMRLLVAREAARFPDLAADYRDRAPEAVIRTLSRGFAALTARGDLDTPDPALAAEHFAFLVLGAELDRRMFRDESTSERDVLARARAGALTFLRAYRPRD